MSFFSHSHDFQLIKPHITNVDQRISNVHNTTTNNNSIQGVHAKHAKNINVAPPNKPGLHRLLDRSIPSATHDSSERYPPSLCYPGTRQGFINLLAGWGRGTSPDHPERLAWVKGPAGVGKSAIAQSTAQALGDMLSATFVFSRPNHRDDPHRFFTSIAYQLAVKQKTFGDFLDQKIQQDLTIVTKPLRLQFDELLIAPAHALKQQGKALPDMTIFVDGLNECKGEAAQQEIVELVAQSLRDGDTPFRWIFFSRPEPGLVSTFNHPEIKPFTAQFELTVTRELDPQIYHFLAARLKEIREKYDLDESWPKGEDLRTLVEISAGLFACAHAMALSIEDPEGESTPQKQLDAVLGLASRIKAENGSNHPLSSLDLFYMLILERMHWRRLADLQLILLANRLTLHKSWDFTQTVACANLLGHSREVFFIICRSLHAVMKVDTKNITFYHASFMDFLEDRTRSGERCIWSAGPRFLRHIMQSLNRTRLRPNLEPVPPLSWRVSPASIGRFFQYWNLCSTFLDLFLLMVLRKIQDDETHRLVQEFDFRRLGLQEVITVSGKGYNTNELLPQLEIAEPQDFIRPLRLKNQLHYFSKLFGNDPRYFAVGNGTKRVILVLLNGRLGDGSAKFCVHSRRALEKFRKELSS